jgi:signal transduction histidine kinase
MSAHWESVSRARVILTERLAAQEGELPETHERLRAAEREQRLLRERQRLMREMHDGVGSSLISALRMVERARTPVDVVQLLKECIDDLKISIDSFDSADADLLALLGALRFRPGPRLSGARRALRLAARQRAQHGVRVLVAARAVGGAGPSVKRPGRKQVS